MKNFIQEGLCLTYPATAAIKSGDVVVEGSIAGIATHDAEAGQDATIRIEGVFELPKAPAVALTFGQPVSWSAGAVADTGGTPLGVAAATVDAAATTAYVLIGYGGGGVVPLALPETEKKAAARKG